MTHHDIQVIIILLLAVVSLATLAARIRVPFPMTLLVGGMVLALIPGLPRIELEPDLVFLLFLPPILFSAAYFTSWRDFRQNARPIGLLAFGCVTLTTFTVAWVARMLIPDMPWSVAITLGAIVSPPDAIAATAIFERLGAPRRVVTVLEGESLVNDASALILYRFGVAAVVGGSFSLFHASLTFVILSVGGVALGLACAWLMDRIVPMITETSVSITFTLLAAVGIYVLAEAVHVSGVLATVAAGIYFGRQASRVLTSEDRVGGRAVWDTVLLVINGLVFIIIGLQLPRLLDVTHGASLRTILLQSLAISLVVIVTRLIWIFPAAYLPRRLIPGLMERDPMPPRANILLIGWSGLRGVVSLASAMALPLTLDNGDAFPYRDRIIFFTFGVIVVTLLGQGSLIPFIMRCLGMSDDGVLKQEMRHARVLAAKAAIARLDEMRGEDWVPDDHQAVLRYRFMHELDHFQGEDHERAHEHHLRTSRLHDEVLDAARQAVVEARDRGEIGDDARIRIEQEFDLEALAKHV